MRMQRVLGNLALLATVAAWRPAARSAEVAELDPAYYHEGELAGSLRSTDPLPVFDPDPQHLWNRIFAAISVRPSLLPARRGGTPLPRIEGGDRVEFLLWPGTTYWDDPANIAHLETLLQQLLDNSGELHSTASLKRVFLQHDLWTLFDHLLDAHIRRRGSSEVRQQRNKLCHTMARVIHALALPSDEIRQLPDNYALALTSGSFSPTHDFDPRRNYLPPDLLNNSDAWQELDFYQARRSEDVERRYVFLHMRAFQGRSYFRVFCRFPAGRPQLESYLKELDALGIDWRASAQHGSISLTAAAPKLPAGSEVALVQFLIALDSDLHLVPTPLVESVRMLIFKNADGTPDSATNLGNGVNALKYTLKRSLALAEGGMQHGGLHREPDDQPVYRVLFENETAPDWGSRGRLFKQTADCRACHAGTGQAGIPTVGSMVNTASIDSGAALGVSHALPAGGPSPHPARTVKWKQAEESYRRLLEYVEEDGSP